MTNSITLRQVADLLGISRMRIEKWISEGTFPPRIFTDPGRRRDWTMSEVIRLAVFVRLVDDVGVDTKTAGHLTQAGVHGFKDDAAYFVAYNGPPKYNYPWMSAIVRKRDLGDFLARGCDYPFVLKAGDDAETMALNSRENKGPASAAIILDLADIEETVKSQWGHG